MNFKQFLMAQPLPSGDGKVNSSFSLVGIGHPIYNRICQGVRNGTLLVSVQVLERSSIFLQCFCFSKLLF